MNNNIETVKCVVCESTTYETITKNGDGTYPINLVVCNKCGLAYLNPRWNKVNYSNYYKLEYDNTYRSNPLNNPSILRPKNNTIVDRIKENGLLQKKALKILDIGSGNGQNLIDLKSIYPTAEYYAIEPSIISQNTIRKNGIHLLSDDVDKSWEKDYLDSFDLIIMRHVLEHFLDPSSILKKVNLVLNDFGMVYIAVPDNLLKNRNEGWLRIAHTYYFNTNSLYNLLVKEHFEPLLLKNGDYHNKYEIFTFSKKSRVDKSLKISQSHYYEQKNIFKAVIKNDKRTLIKLKKKIIKIMKAVKNTFANILYK
tara:strand:+ start:73 stop:1002 length:930 start_codon:yes stop_codon:yes gene_type:complete